MATYLFAWNPAIWNWPELAGDIRKLARRGHFETEWACGRHRNIDPGSRAFLVRLGVAPKGIFGSGVTLTPPVTRSHWIEKKAAAGILTNYTTLRLEHLFEMPAHHLRRADGGALPAFPLGRAIFGNVPARDDRRRVGESMGEAGRRGSQAIDRFRGRSPTEPPRRDDANHATKVAIACSDTARISRCGNEGHLSSGLTTPRRLDSVHATPSRGSAERDAAGNTYCQPISLAARG